MSTLNQDVADSVMGGDASSLAKYLDDGGDPNAMFGGKKLVELAGQHGHLELVRMLLQHGAVVTKDSIAKIDLDDATDWRIESEAVERSFAEIVKVLTKAGASPYAKDRAGINAFHCVDKEAFPILYSALESLTSDAESEE